MTGLADLSLAEMVGGLEDGAISSVDLVAAHLAAIEAANPELNAVWDVDAEGALTAARDSDARRGGGRTLSELDGIPAAYCGVVGFKPSFDLLPTAGVTPLAWTLDHVGPLARSVVDLALSLPVLANVAPEETDLGGLVFGWPAEVDSCEIEPAVQGVIDAALDLLRAGGVTIRQVKLGLGELSLLRRAALLVIEAEGAVALERLWDSHPEAFSETLAGMLAFGRDAPASKYVKAFRRIEDAGERINAALEEVDALVLPTVPQTAFSADARVPVNQADLTSIANYAGTPAISLPLPTEGAPVGLQLVGGFYDDAKLIGIALAVEELLRG